MASQGGSGADIRELVITRGFAAARDAVFRAWTEAGRVARWFGPRGFATVVDAWDARPGGPIRAAMVAPDGTAIPMGGEFHEVVPGDRLVFTTTAFPDESGRPQLEVRGTAAFADRDGKTVVTLRAEVVRATPAVAGSLAGMEEGWNQSLDKLAEELARG
ncbi:MAG: SRPBCC domain-containing protein [Gemmataceae bacterium]|nr:SRPBCC domain-containing protein [Gemmataceae bacterium]